MRRIPNVERLSWDDWIRQPIAMHGVSEGKVDDVIAGAPVYRETYKDRLQVIEPTPGGRVLAIVIGPVPDQPRVYHTVSARPVSRKERRCRQERQEPIAE